jgi:hypothetical protein
MRSQIRPLTDCEGEIAKEIWTWFRRGVLVDGDEHGIRGVLHTGRSDDEVFPVGCGAIRMILAGFQEYLRE